MNDIRMAAGMLRLVEKPTDIVFSAGARGPILIIKSDGRLEKGEGFETMDAASVALFNCLSRHMPTWIAELRDRAEKAEAALAALKGI